MSESYLADMMKDKLYGVVCLMGKQGNIARYVYLSIRMDRLGELTEARESGKPFEPANFGKVLACGDGVPDDEVRRQMEEIYGFDHTEFIDLGF